jgi:hypothetical protein
MSDPQAILRRARSLGLRLSREGDRIAIAPARLCPGDLLDMVRAHKQAVMDLLEEQLANLTPDCAPWLHVARQVVAGEFKGADRSMIDSLTIGLRRIRHPVCRQALAHLGRDVGETGCANNQ